MIPATIRFENKDFQALKDYAKNNRTTVTDVIRVSTLQKVGVIKNDI